MLAFLDFVSQSLSSDVYHNSGSSLLCLLSSYLLVRYPQVLSKLRKEIETVAENRTNLLREDLKRMPYLANVLKESV